MDLEKPWYYLNRSRQVGPFSQSELRLLFAKEVISPNTLVWSPGGSWRAVRELPNEPVIEEPVIETRKWHRNLAVVVLGICVFFVGTGVVLEAPPASELNLALAMTFEEQGSQGHLNQVGDRLVRGNEIVTAKLVKPAERAEGRTNSPSIDFVVRPDFASLPSRTSPAAQVASAHPEFVQEFWRSIAYSNVVDRYDFYLRRHPSGPFAKTATARIRELRERSTQEDSEIAKKASSIPWKAPKAKKLAKATVVKKSIPKPVGRCGIRNIEQCRQRCRDGEARACHDLRRPND